MPSNYISIIKNVISSARVLHPPPPPHTFTPRWLAGALSPCMSGQCSALSFVAVLCACACTCVCVHMRARVHAIRSPCLAGDRWVLGSVVGFPPAAALVAATVSDGCEEDREAQETMQRVPI